MLPPGTKFWDLEAVPVAEISPDGGGLLREFFDNINRDVRD